MLLHLEAGSCESGRDLDFVNDVASKCRQSDSYKSNNPDFDFQCPTCKTLFSFMSGLLQHAESDACEEDVQQKPLGQFINYLWSRI